MALGDLFPAWRAERIVYEDDDLLVVDKPEGVSTHAPAPERSDDAHGRLLRFLEERGEISPYLGIHQRLDRDTSGVLLFTRNKAKNKAIAEQFEGRLVKKSYVAGVVDWPKGRETGRLVHRLSPDKAGLMRPVPARAKGGQEAVTSYRVKERVGRRTLLELCPETGRTHQIRAQLAAEGSPVAGDPLYGDGKDDGAPAATRLWLHAASLTLRHPTTGAATTFRAPAPDGLSAWLKRQKCDPFESVDAIERALRRAADARYGTAQMEGTTAFRIANGEGDGLHGLAVDVYGDFLVVSLSSPEADAAREAVLDAAARLGAQGVYLKVRPKDSSRLGDVKRDLAPPRAVRGEDAPHPMTIREHGLPFEVRLGEGMSTGIFLDQRENRRRIRELASGARVLNLFAYTGGFTVAAAMGGARASVTIDVSRGACEQARRNLEAISADSAAHVVVEADAQVWLDARKSGRDSFDLAILDPPSFATTKTSRFSAGSDMRALAAATLRVLAPGGRALICTNYLKIRRDKLRRTLHDAARDAGREVTQMKDMPDPSDFPPAHLGEPHLKSMLITVK